MILVLDTQSENIFIGLWDRGESTWLAKESFLGGRELNSLVIQKLDIVLTSTGDYQAVLKMLNGIIVAAGPGSFTGLRIGISVANTLAYSLDIPIVAPEEANNYEELLQKGLKVLDSAGSQFETVVVPYYGAEPHITTPKH